MKSCDIESMAANIDLQSVSDMTTCFSKPENLLSETMKQAIQEIKLQKLLVKE